MLCVDTQICLEVVDANDLSYRRSLDSEKSQQFLPLKIAKAQISLCNFPSRFQLKYETY